MVGEIGGTESIRINVGEWFVCICVLVWRASHVISGDELESRAAMELASGTTSGVCVAISVAAMASCARAVRCLRLGFLGCPASASSVHDGNVCIRILVS